MISQAPCRPETKKYRECLREKQSSGRNCDTVARAMEMCREKWRISNNIALEYDGTRIVPTKECMPINDQIQQCLKWKKGHQEKCQHLIDELKDCMKRYGKGVVVKPTSGDKIWSDYNKEEKKK
mmetsp:Transcript_31068/g.35393  ORF Transcript_31068/g.35393 Transcript_31068/m.35393 type:complete len:124 (+) Transcript_31068:36-407(+)